MTGRERIVDAMADAIGSENVGAGASEHSIDGMRPGAVARPRSLEDLSRAVAVAWESDLAVAPVGGGTRVDLGDIPRRLDVVMDVSQLDRVVRHTPADLTLTVEAGTPVAAIQAMLIEHGQFLALDPPLPDRATVGGTLAAGVSGPLKWQYGHPRDLVIGMKIVQADGSVTSSGGQVVKNVSGYDMTRLHVGGLGTLGIIAEASFKLTPLPKRESTLVAAFEERLPCLRAGLDIFRGRVMPLALCSFDRGVNERGRCADLPGGHLLAVRAGGRPMAVERQVRECAAACGERGAAHVEILDEAGAERLWRWAADFGWSEDTRPEVVARASLLPDRIPEVVESLDGLGGAAPNVITHPAYGTVLINWFHDGGADEKIDDVLKQARDLVCHAGGRLVIERCSTDVKRRFDVWGDVGESLAIMRRMKEQYDPRGILNPGRFAGGI